MLRKLLAVTALAAVGLTGSALAAPSISTYPRPGTTPRDIITGPNGNAWFAESTGSNIAEIQPGDPPTVVNHASVAANPAYLGVGPDGFIWYTGAAAVGKMNPATGAAVQFPFANIDPGGTDLAAARGVSAGPDGKLWIADTGNQRIVKVNPANPENGEVAVPLPQSNAPRELTPGADGNMWVAGNPNAANEPEIFRVTPGGVVTPFSAGSTGMVQDITSGADGNIWWTDPGAVPQFVGKFTMSTGTISKSLTPGQDSFGIAPGPYGVDLWTSQFNNHAVAQVGFDGAVSPVTGATSQPRFVALNTNTKEMWFASDENMKEAIGVVRGIDPPAAPAADAGGAAAAAADTTKPVISALSASAAKKKVSFSLSEAGKVTLTYEIKATGRKVKGKCKAGAKKGKRCSLYKPSTTQAIQGKQGVNEATLPTKVTKKPGSYRVTGTAVDAAGNLSLATSKSFRIAKKKKKR